MSGAGPERSLNASSWADTQHSMRQRVFNNLYGTRPLPRRQGKKYDYYELMGKFLLSNGLYEESKI